MLAIGVQTVNAQVKIGDNPTTINKASILELEHNSKGLLFPSVMPVWCTGCPRLYFH